jgi:glycosyltransferase involved in cell wall biosynthesis
MSKKPVVPPKVLVLTTTFPRWDSDTVPSFVYELSKELRENESDVLVLAPHHPGAHRRESMAGLDVYRYPYFLPKRYQRLCYEGSILDTIKSSYLAILQIPLLAISLFVHTLWLVRKEDIEVIHSHWLVPNGLVAALVREITGVRHVMTLHAGGVLGLKRLPFSSQLATFISTRTDVVAPVSGYIRDSYLEMLPANARAMTSKFRVQPMGAYTQNYDEYNGHEPNIGGVTEGKVVGLYVGRLAEKKGVADLVEAGRRLDGHCDDFQLIIVGTGPLEQDIRRMIVESDASGMIHLTGWISDDALKKLYARSDFVIVPSIETASGDTEGMPTVIAEAFAAGSPVIASDVGGIADIVRDDENGYLVEQKRPDKLSRQMEFLIEDEHRRSVMSACARETARELDWSVCGETYAQLFTAVCAPQDAELAREIA